MVMKPPPIPQSPSAEPTFEDFFRAHFGRVYGLLIYVAAVFLLGALVFSRRDI